MLFCSRIVLRRSVGLVAVVLACLMITGTGCVTRREIRPEKALSDTRLFITRSGDKVTLSWDSKPDRAYTIYYNTTRKARSAWKVLPGFDRIRGTGRTLMYSDRVPAEEPRHYRLQSEPALTLSR